MTLVPSLLQAIVLMDGEALVLHVGDKPYVVAESGQVSLANAPMTAESVADVIDALLPAESKRLLGEVGATQCVLPDNPLFPDERFSVVAARGGDDLWLEIRRTTTRIIEASAPDAEPQPAVILPLTRTPVRGDVPPPLAETALSGLDRLLRLAAARGASTLYVSSGMRPSIRIDGELRMLDGAPALSAGEVEGLLITCMPGRRAEDLRSGVAREWMLELAELGRVRCLAFRDHRGPGCVFRIMPSRPVTTEQLGLSREIQALAAETEGVLIVTGPRLSGKRTLMSAFVDYINRTRHVHVVTVEREIAVVHERAAAMVSQREVRDAGQVADAVKSALREDPDVLVVQEVRTAELVDLTLDAAAGGRLVICGCTARSASAAIDTVIDLAPPAERRRIELALARHLQGVVAQVLLKKTGGGRLAARELLLNTPAVASLLADGRTAQLPLAIEGGRRQGMVPLNDALGGFAQSGAVDVREAYRCAADRPGLLALLQRQGIDVSGLERLA